MARTRQLARRTFLQGGIAAVSSGAFLARGLASGRPSANDQIAVGVIGAGIRGRALVEDMPGDARIVAVCDCFTPRIDGVRALIPDKQITPYSDYREMIAQAKLDAVVITATDRSQSATWRVSLAS